MNDLLIFAIVASAVMTVAYAVWSVLQRGMTFYRLNRASLLAIIAASVAAGALYAGGHMHGPGAAIIGRLEAIGIVAGAAVPAGDSVHALPWREVVMAVYATGMAVTGLWHAVNLAAVVWIIARSRRYGLGGLTLAVHDRRWPGPFSWGRWIVVPRGIATGDRETLHMVVCHERAHLRGLHWADLLIAGAVKTVMWFNPSAWLLSADLVDTHEYEADSAVTERYDATGYQMLLIKTTVGTRLQAMADSLNHSSLKKRITMMMKNPTKSRARWRALAMVPAVALTLTVVNVPAVASTLRSLTAPARAVAAAPADDSKGTQKSDNRQDGTPLPDQFPQYIGGEQKMYDDIYEIMKDVPEGLPDGKTIVRFVVTAEGKVTDPEIVRSGGEALDKYVLENVTRLGLFTPAMADGKPVAVTYTLPVHYKSKGE
ncbi:MAG: M56 family metallopeptidase [Bacteroidales bacterium]|nr:M56 family metallopeptidase [Bacteroidales bacterium]